MTPFLNHGFFVLAGTLLPVLSLAQSPAMDSLLKTVELLPASIIASQMPDRAFFASSDISLEELEKRDGSMDLPFLLRYTPSLVVTSDAGAGTGYTSLRIRGSEQSHINVTINGITLNDAESHQVYWVDLPDVASSIDGLQVQRGIGTAANGPGAFGATVALNTLSFDQEPSARLVLGSGSFGSQRAMVKWSSGLIGQGFYLEGRASRVLSDGYVDRATSDLSSLQLGMGYLWNSGHLAYTALLGHERTYQAWYGVPEIAMEGTEEQIWAWASNSSEYGYGSDTERIEDLIDRRSQHNYYRYENEVDDYRQDHHQLHLDQYVMGWDVGLTGHYTGGAGYYEQFKPQADLMNYGVEPFSIGDSILSVSDVIRRRWLDNDFAGTAFNVQKSWSHASVQFGGGAFWYEGEHFGIPIWMEHPGTFQPGQTYYSNVGRKFDRHVFVGSTSKWFDGRLQTVMELQARRVSYAVDGRDRDLRTLDVDDDLFFLNPKAGIDWQANTGNRFFASVAQGNREPVRNDYIDRLTEDYPHPEQLTDWEVGWENQKSNWSLQMVSYLMLYRDQLVQTGALNDVGSSVHINVDRSYRAGLEWMFKWQPHPSWVWSGTTTWSSNKIDSFSETLYDYADGFESEVFIDHGSTDISFSPNVTASSVASWTFFNRGEFEGTAEWAIRYVGEQFLDNTSNSNRMLDAYSVHDLRLRWVWLRANGSRIALSGYLRNALDAGYTTNGWTYSYLYGGLGAMTTENYVYPQAGRHGMLSLEVSF